MWMKFEQGTKGTPIARTSRGKICFPPRDANIIVGEWYEVAIEQEEDRFCRLKIVQDWSKVDAITGCIAHFSGRKEISDEEGKEISYPPAYQWTEELYPDEVWQFRVDHEHHRLVPVKWINGAAYQHTEAVAEKFNSFRLPDDDFLFECNRYYPTQLFIPRKQILFRNRQCGDSIDTTQISLDECERFYVTHVEAWRAQSRKKFHDTDGGDDNFPYDLHGHGEGL